MKLQRSVHSKIIETILKGTEKLNYHFFKFIVGKNVKDVMICLNFNYRIRYFSHSKLMDNQNA